MNAHLCVCLLHCLFRHTPANTDLNTPSLSQMRLSLFALIAGTNASFISQLCRDFINAFLPVEHRLSPVDGRRTGIVAPPPLSDAELSTSQYQHVVIIPDVHGDAEGFLRSLFIALEKIDGTAGLLPYSEFKSVFGAATERNILPARPLSSARPGSVALVQLGDLVDRGPDSAQCVEIALKAESVLGWKVLILHGNHELQRLAQYDPEYLHRREIENAGGSAAVAMERMRSLVATKLYDKGLLLVRFSSLTTVPQDDPRNPNTLFVHAGIDLDWLLAAIPPSSSLNAINAYFNEQIKVESSLLKWYGSLRSPVWLRDYFLRPESEVCGDPLTSVLEHFNVARIIVGHTPTYGRVRTVCGGRILITDVSMSRWMSSRGDDMLIGGNPVAVIMTMGTDGLLDSIMAHFDSLVGSNPRTDPLFPPHPPVIDDDDAYRYRNLNLPT